MSSCKLCGSLAATSKHGPLEDVTQYTCPTCGNFSLSGTADITITDKKYKNDLFILSGFIKNRNEINEFPKINSTDIDKIIMGSYPKTVTQKIEHFLLFMEKHTEYFGQNIHLDYNHIYPIVYAKNREEFINLVLAIRDLGYIKRVSDKYSSLTIMGFNKIESLKETNIHSKNCFIAISFLDEYDSIYIDGIEPALKETSFNPIYLKAKEHNNLIDDEIIGGVKKSRFIIAEFSSNNQNVYFEAGYGMGLNIPVIRICQKDEAKNLHFDIEHYNTIFYENHKDLKDKLIKRINASIL